jgi:hypothetical protein
MSPRNGADPHDVGLEIAIHFGKEIENEGCTFAPSAIPVFRQYFEATVGKALKKTPDVWEGQKRIYALKVVGKIARCACRAAKKFNGGVIDGEILDNCAMEKIAFERTVCEYAESQAKLKKQMPGGLPWEKVEWTLICPT